MFMISQIVWWLIFQLVILHGFYHPQYLNFCLFLLGFITLAQLNFFWKLITLCLNNLFCLTFCYLIQRKEISKLFVVNWITYLLPWSIFIWPFNILSMVPPFKISTFHWKKIIDNHINYFLWISCSLPLIIFKFAWAWMVEIRFLWNTIDKYLVPCSLFWFLGFEFNSLEVELLI